MAVFSGPVLGEGEDGVQHALHNDTLSISIRGQFLLALTSPYRPHSQLPIILLLHPKVGCTEVGEERAGEGKASWRATGRPES